MAYSPISNEEIEPGKPGSSGLFIKIRDNPEAIAAGLAGAPKIVSAAFADNTINGIKVLDNSVNGTKIIDNSISTQKLGDVSVTNEKVANNSLAFNAKILATTVNGSWGTVAAGAVINIPKGIYDLYSVKESAHTVALELFVNAAWHVWHQDLSVVAYLQVISNGANVRLVPSGGGAGTTTTNFTRIY